MRTVSFLSVSSCLTSEEEVLEVEIFAEEEVDSSITLSSGSVQATTSPNDIHTNIVDIR